MISGETKVCAVIGDPVKHSLSPCIQNAAFKHLKLNYVYIAFEVGLAELETAIQGIRSLKIHGLNVTTPLKVDAARHLDTLDRSAEVTGAVNTVLNQGGLIGYNTDGEGARKALKAGGHDPKNKKVVILGAGGASRSVSYSLASEACEVVILNRTLERAERLVEKLANTFGNKVRCGKLCRNSIKKELKDADILINATTLGMRLHEDKTPIDRALLRSNLVVFDLVYDPPETKLLSEAKSIGAKTVKGITMLVYQGAASFEIWTGRKAPVDVMNSAAEKEIRNIERRHKRRLLLKERLSRTEL
jgi:shikimate dehydrogenase